MLGSAIARVLDVEADLTVIGIARTGAEAALIASRANPGVVLIDFHLPDMTGPAAAAMIRGGVPDAAFVFHSAEDSETALLDAIPPGASAYLTKHLSPPQQIFQPVPPAAPRAALIPP